MKYCASFALIAAALFWCTAAPAAHDVPNDVRIQVFLKPEGQRLRLLVRAPLASMNDISWPTAGVFLNLADPEMKTALNEGAKDWIGDRIEIYEDDVRLGDPRLAAVRVSLPIVRERSLGFVGLVSDRVWCRQYLGTLSSPVDRLDARPERLRVV